MFRPLQALTCCAALWATLLAPAGVKAEEPPPILAEQITPFSVWLDFNGLARPNAVKPALPIWFESFQSDTVPADDANPPKTNFRLRVRRMPGLHRELLLRIYFDDLPDMSPSISAWSELGKERFRSGSLGTGVGLPTQETVIIPLEGTDYIDMEVAGDGSSIRGAFISSLKEATTRLTNDFAALPDVTDPFGAATLSAPDTEDKKLFGRVKALIDPGTVRISQKDGVASSWQFELTQQPLVAVVNFEVLNADLTAPPIIIGNDGEPVLAIVQWPDLADPGFRGEARPLEPSLRFQYTGWLRAQAVIPGNRLHSGLNKITVTLSEDSGPIAVRNLELQLKQNWKHFDYILSPVNP